MINAVLAFSVRQRWLVLLVSLLFGALDGLKSAGFDLSLFHGLPLFELGLAWLLPTLCAMGFCLLLRGPQLSVVNE